MPGIEKCMSRYPQLYSRFGFAHPYPPLSREEMDFIFRKQWQKLGKECDTDDVIQAAASTPVIAAAKAAEERYLQNVVLATKGLQRHFLMMPARALPTG